MHFYFIFPEFKPLLTQYPFIRLAHISDDKSNDS